MRTRRLLAGTVVLAVSLAVGLSVVGAQNQRTAAEFVDGARTGDRMRVVIDGRRNPELIPDRVAVAMFLSAIAIPGDAEPGAVASMDVKVKRMKLTDADTALLRAELAGLHGRLRAQQQVIDVAYSAARRERTPQAEARALAAREGRYALTSESYARLRRTLSAEGARQLTTQIGRVKTQTKALGPRDR